MPFINRSATIASAIVISGALLLTAGCGGGKDAKTSPTEAATSNSPAAEPTKPDPNAAGTATAPDAAGKPAAPGDASAGKGSGASQPGQQPSAPAANGNGPAAVQVVANPADITVMVNKTFKLPDKYAPQDLVEPNVPFTFKEHLEKRKMRKEAAAALEKLFAAAMKDGLPLAGVSAYRSYETQTGLYNNYVKKDGEEAANKYSAKPGHSEHQTGLAIDVSGADGKCAAADCFATTKEAQWLVQHAPEYGYIVRYPNGKEAITGYQYEPWHIRYVGVEMAKDIAKKGVTLEEYMGGSVAAVKPK